LGGAAVFFYLQHPYSFLSDSNPELVELYQVVRDNVGDLIRMLRHYRNDENYYDQVHLWNPAEPTALERVARLIFANNIILKDKAWRTASLILQNAKVVVADFEDAVSCAVENDFVFFDPPCQLNEAATRLIAYSPERFDDLDDERLATTYQYLDNRGCYLMLRHFNTPLVRELYADFRIMRTQKVIGQGESTELIITNY
ncbi:MAG: DNA adenine methylase, partial [Nitrososphaera sp.]